MWNSSLEIDRDSRFRSHTEAAQMLIDDPKLLDF